MDYYHIVEEKIKQALKNGEFDDLPGKGKPLPKDEFAHLPEELRNGYRILKNAHMLPEEMMLKKEMVDLEELLSAITDPSLISHYTKEWKEKKLRFDMMMEKRDTGNTGVFRRYQNKIHRRFGF
ncbi:UNVERIFIED_CONTAM: DUF1992 domain-containing protein [Halobacillus marinus]